MATPLVTPASAAEAAWEDAIAEVAASAAGNFS